MQGTFNPPSGAKGDCTCCGHRGAVEQTRVSYHSHRPWHHYPGHYNSMIDCIKPFLCSDVNSKMVEMNIDIHTSGLAQRNTRMLRTGGEFDLKTPQKLRMLPLLHQSDCRG